MTNIEKALCDSIDDLFFSTEEKATLDQVLQPFQNEVETLHHARNKAFEIARMHTAENPAHAPRVIKWLERVVRTIDNRRDKGDYPASKAYFGPGNHCKRALISTLAKTKTSVDICVFSITDNEITKALLQAWERQIAIRIITDDDKAMDEGSDIERLRTHGIPTRMDHSPSHMHHKFAIFDRTILLNGSFNWTRSASERNHENIAISQEPAMVIPFQEMFDQLWQEFRE